VELSREEVATLLRLVRAHRAELERALTNLEETEGLDATKFRLRRELVPAIERADDLVVKLEAAEKEIGPYLG
jgi:hypothetical protein